MSSRTLLDVLSSVPRTLPEDTDSVADSGAPAVRRVKRSAANATIAACSFRRFGCRHGDWRRRSQYANDHLRRNDHDQRNPKGVAIGGITGLAAGTIASFVLMAGSRHLYV